MVGDIFGRKHFAKIRGYMSVFYVWGSVIGPVVAGAIWDRWQTYEPMLWGLVVMFFLSGVFYSLLANRGSGRSRNKICSKFKVQWFKVSDTGSSIFVSGP